MGLAKPAVALVIWLAINLMFLAFWRPMPPRLRVTLLVTTLFAVMAGLAVGLYHENRLRQAYIKHQAQAAASASASYSPASQAQNSAAPSH